MRRRDLVARAVGASVAWPLAVRAQAPAIPLVGFLAASTAEASAPFYAAFLAGLGETGYVVDRTVAIASRWADGRHERLPILAAELVALKVAVITATSSPAAVAAKETTQTTPIVFLSADPVALGLVESFSRPGGNATGVNLLTSELIPKRLELLRELIPKATSVAVLVNPGNPNAPAQRKDAVSAAHATGHSLDILEARSGSDIEHVFARITSQRPEALLVGPDSLFFGQRDQIIALAARHRIPAIYDWPDFVAAGGLISYGPNLRDALRLLGTFTGKILRGARPADFPVQQPVRFELVINLKTARALGLSVPTALLARADEVIE